MDSNAVVTHAQLEARIARLLRVIGDRLSDIQPDAPRPLPAPALTQDAIVAALKADPAMAGRVIVCVADTMWAEDRFTVSTAAKQACISPSVSRGAPGALQSFAGALAAASYRG